MNLQMPVIGGGVEVAAARYDATGPCQVVAYLNDFAQRHADEFLSTQITDESFDLMALLVKLGVRIDPTPAGAYQ